MQDVRQFLEAGTVRDELVVILHGFARARERMAALRQTVGEFMPTVDIYAPELAYSKGPMRCYDKVESVVAYLVGEIDALVKERDYKTITLVGHSFGGVIARKIAIVAHGEQKGVRDPQTQIEDRPAPFEQEFAAFREPRIWATKIKRLVLLAGMNRGWTVSSAMDWWTTVKWSAGQLFGEMILGRRPTLFAIRKGAPFLVQTRLQWLALMDPDYGARPDLIAVQLLGTQDDFVPPDDNVDYAVDLFGKPQSYFYIEVPHSDHGSLVDVAKDGRPDTQEVRNARRTKFKLALTADRDGLARECIPREQMADHLPPEPKFDIDDVVFVIHGIRDKGFWTQKIARSIKREAAKANRKFESCTESYGYFAMLPFVLGTVRQRKVEWLMDRFAEVRARYPRATFHYVGHSNGTYLAAQALQDYPAARFKHVVFAGSVVRRDYQWLDLIKPKDAPPGSRPRVEKVLNYVATKDWVVALFPKGMQPWRYFNLGSAGHDGFTEATALGPVRNVTYIVGSHGAGHEEPHWEDIARFIVSGDPPRTPLSPVQSRFWRTMGHISCVLFPLLVAAVLALGILLFWSIFWRLPCEWWTDLRNVTWGPCTRAPTGGESGLRAIAFFVYLWVVYLAVTRF
jgi:pimeloyl-ACP methyl ester carboxylesterase